MGQVAIIRGVADGDVIERQAESVCRRGDFGVVADQDGGGQAFVAEAASGGDDARVVALGEYERQTAPDDAMLAGVDDGRGWHVHGLHFGSIRRASLAAGTASAPPRQTASIFVTRAGRIRTAAAVLLDRGGAGQDIRWREHPEEIEYICV